MLTANLREPPFAITFCNICQSLLNEFFMNMEDWNLWNNAVFWGKHLCCNTKISKFEKKYDFLERMNKMIFHNICECISCLRVGISTEIKWKFKRKLVQSCAFQSSVPNLNSIFEMVRILNLDNFRRAKISILTIWHR